MNSNLTKLRETAHLTQRALGGQLGLSQQVISRIERDISTVTLDHLVVLADYYKVSIDYLLGRTRTKRTLEEQQAVKDILQEHYSLVQAFESLSVRDKELVWGLIENMRRNRGER